MRSALALPNLLPWIGDDRAPDVTIHMGRVPEYLPDLMYRGPLLQFARDGSCRFAVPNIAAYHVDASGREVVIDSAMGAAAQTVGVFLLGTVFGILCFKHGLVPLHASCVRIDGPDGGRAVIFAGPSGVGKSTLAAAFFKRGHTILADDITVMDVNAPGGPVVVPTFPRLKLWGDVLHHMDVPVESLTRTRAELEKYLLPVERAFSPTPLPIAAVYHLLQVSDERHAELRLLRGVEAVTSLSLAVYRGQAFFPIIGGNAGLLATSLHAASLMKEHWLWRRTFDLARLDDAAATISARHGVTG